MRTWQAPVRASPKEFDVMGSIVSFMPRATPIRRADPVEGGAAIVIFPGVRYERQPEPADLTPFQPAQSAAQIPR